MSQRKYIRLWTLFTLYTHSLSTVISQSGLSYHFFADDSQLHKSSVPSDFPVLACCLKDCIEDVAEWMADSKLKMNDDKTELMAIGTRSKLSQVIPNLAPMSISVCDIPFSQSVRNLGFYLNETLSMDAHIKYLCRILFCQLHRIGKICSFLSTDAANKLAVSLILSRLDYCNSLLAGLPDNKLNKLQRIQNHAARLVLHKSRHASALLRTHHWLPVKARIQYKIACLCFQCIYRNSMPPYISDLLHPYCPSRTLHSLDTSLLTVPRFSLETFGKRSFSVFGPTVWNSLPLSLRKSIQTHIGQDTDTRSPPPTLLHTQAWIMPIYHCEDINAPYHRLWSTWSTMTWFFFYKNARAMYKLYFSKTITWS